MCRDYLIGYYSSCISVSRNFTSRVVIAGTTFGPTKLPQAKSGNGQ